MNGRRPKLEYLWGCMAGTPATWAVVYWSTSRAAGLSAGRLFTELVGAAPFLDAKLMWGSGACKGRLRLR